MEHFDEKAMALLWMKHVDGDIVFPSSCINFGCTTKGGNKTVGFKAPLRI
jgi:hypothetical protein